MTAKYEKFGVQFIYPENWTVGEEELNEWPHGVTLETPGAGYWELQLYPSPLDPADLCAQVLEAMREQYPELEVESIAEEICDLPAVGYDLSFFCLDFLITSHVRCVSKGAHTYLLIYQAESREFDAQQRVFEAITISLLRG